MCCEDGDKAFYICALLFCMGYFHNTHHEKKKCHSVVVAVCHEQYFE